MGGKKWLNKNNKIKSNSWTPLSPVEAARTSLQTRCAHVFFNTLVHANYLTNTQDKKNPKNPERQSFSMQHLPWLSLVQSRLVWTSGGPCVTSQHFPLFFLTVNQSVFESTKAPIHKNVQQQQQEKKKNNKPVRRIQMRIRRLAQVVGSVSEWVC